MAKHADYAASKPAINRRLLEMQARQWDHFKRELRRRGAEDILAEPSAEMQVAQLGPDEQPPGR